MRTRPIRPYINRQVVLFGIRLGDLRYVGGSTGVMLIIPLLFNLRLYGIPLALPLSILTLMITGTFFNIVRLRHRPLYLEHELSSWYRDLTGIGQNLRSRTVQEREPRRWIIESEESTTNGADFKAKSNWIKTSS